MNIVDLFFGTVGKDWCFISFILVIIAFIGFLGSISAALVALFKIKKFSFTTIFAIALGVFVNALMYMQTRVIYSMCVNSLK
jgi:uncharacterized membrane protein YsdA (DUF1294 family)